FVLDQPKIGLHWPVPDAVMAGRPALARYADREVVLGIRPEAFRLAEPGSGRPTGPVILTEMTGADAYVFLDLPVPNIVPGRAKSDEEELVHDGVTRITARVEPVQLPDRGQPVGLEAPLSRVHVFDPATGEAIR
ncbi:MAG: hypothetical protein INR67_19195, partial [Jatrophihabitans endophyticus]